LGLSAADIQGKVMAAVSYPSLLPADNLFHDLQMHNSQWLSRATVSVCCYMKLQLVVAVACDSHWLLLYATANSCCYQV
jgi:hypothetical protein